MLLRAKLVENLTETGVREVDFTGEPYEWQRRWTEDSRGHKSLIIYNNTLKAKLFSFYNNVRSKRKNTDSEGEIYYHNPLDLKPEKS